jgi:hypothetical protein
MITNISSAIIAFPKWLDSRAVFFDCRDPRHLRLRMSESTAQRHGSYNNFNGLGACQIAQAALSDFHHGCQRSRAQMTNNGNDTCAISRGPPPT